MIVLKHREATVNDAEYEKRKAEVRRQVRESRTIPVPPLRKLKDNSHLFSIDPFWDRLFERDPGTFPDEGN
jgi:hypothetical protein